MDKFDHFEKYFDQLFTYELDCFKRHTTDHLWYYITPKRFQKFTINCLKSSKWGSLYLKNLNSILKFKLASQQFVSNNLFEFTINTMFYKNICKKHIIDEWQLITDLVIQIDLDILINIIPKLPIHRFDKLQMSYLLNNDASLLTTDNKRNLIYYLTNSFMSTEFIQKHKCVIDIDNNNLNILRSCCNNYQFTKMVRSVWGKYILEFISKKILLWSQQLPTNQHTLYQWKHTISTDEKHQSIDTVSCLHIVKDSTFIHMPNVTNVISCNIVPMGKERLICSTLSIADNHNIYANETDFIFIRNGSIVLNKQLADLIGFDMGENGINYSIFNTQTEGLLIPFSKLIDLYPQIDNFKDGSELSHYLEIAAFDETKIQLLRTLNHLPFDDKCFLRKDAFINKWLDIFVTQYNDEQRQVFMLVFWKIDGICFKELYKIKGLQTFIFDILSVTSDDDITRHDLFYKHIWVSPIYMDCINVNVNVQVECSFHIFNGKESCLSAILENSKYPIVLDGLLQKCEFEKVKIHSDIEHCLSSCAFDLFHAINLHPNVKRVIYQHMINHNIRYPFPFKTDNTIVLSDDTLNLNLYTKVNFIPSTIIINDLILMDYNRQTNKFIDESHHHAFLNNYSLLLDANVFDLYFFKEDGIGQSVYEQIISCYWGDMISKQILTKHDSGGYDFISAYDLEQQLDSKEIKALNVSVFMLGFVSALCIVRGIYLSTNMSTNLWNYLYQTSDNFINQDFENKCQQLKDVKNCDLLTTLGVYNCNQQIETIADRNAILQYVLFPNKKFLQSFKKGWMIFGSAINLAPLLLNGENLNDIFIDPSESKTILNIANFKHLFLVQNQEKDQQFINYINTLSIQQLEKLVEFITGKKRLPILELGESKMAIKWDIHSSLQLPFSQNCFNTLILPYHLTHVAQFQNCLQVIYEFENDFGLT
jgi:hypothetical protein